MKPYVPTDNVKVLQMLRDAAQRIADHDDIDRSHGFPTPVESGLSSTLRTAISAMVAGLAGDSFDLIAESMYFVVQAEYLARQLESKLEIHVNTGKRGS